MKNCIITLILTASLICFYALFIEVNWLEVTHHEFKADITSLKIAHLSDLHIRKIGVLENKVIASLIEEKPDIIFVTGDFVSDEMNIDSLQSFLSKLEARLGVWGVLGNWEHWVEHSFLEKSILSDKKVKIIKNEAIQINGELQIVGLDDYIGRERKLNQVFKGFINNKFCIGLFHSPVDFPILADKCVLNLSGHTHGGQIKLPFISPLWLPVGSGNYVAGWYEREKAKMYVSRGIGTSIIEARLFSRPELSYITIGR